MEMKLFNTVDNDNVINKDLTLIHTLNIKLKNDVSLINPIIILSKINGVNFFMCNYAYLSKLNRYYFIRDVEIIDNINFRFMLECDVLESFKNDILQSNARFSRRISEGDYHNITTEYILKPTIERFQSDVTLEATKNIIMSVVGGVQIK